ncbi:unnamed protein product, partial [Tetraodon nigroviridis]
MNVQLSQNSGDFRQCQECLLPCCIREEPPSEASTQIMAALDSGEAEAAPSPKSQRNHPVRWLTSVCLQATSAGSSSGRHICPPSGSGTAEAASLCTWRRCDRRRTCCAWYCRVRAAPGRRGHLLRFSPGVPATATASTDLTLEERTGEGDTPLTLAAAAGLVDNVRILLGHGASPHNTNSCNESPLLIGTDTTSHEQVPPSGGPSGEAEIVRHGSEPRPGRGLCGAGVFNQVDGHARGRKGSQADGGSPQPAPLLTLLSFLHQVGCTDILKLLLRHGAKVSSRDAHGVTPLAIAAERGNTEALDVLVRHGEHQNPSSSAKGQPHSALQSGCLPPGGDVKAQATNGDSVLYDAAGSGNVDSVELLLGHGADPNVASTPSSCRSTERQNYGDLRKTPLYFAVSNGDVTCAKVLLAAGARTDLDPLRCVLVAVRAERHDLVRLLLSYGADVNCYFRVISNTLFPTALQYCLSDHVMLRLLLNAGYQAYKCFQCCHGDDGGAESRWTDLRNQAYQIYSQPDVITFCEFLSVSWLTHLVGGVVRTLLDYVGYVSICPKLRRILKTRPEWEEISDILSNPRSLQHLCRLAIRGNVSLKVLNDPGAVAALPFPPTLKNYVTFGGYT